MFDFNIKLAEKTIGVHPVHYSTRAWCEDYLTDGPADVDIAITREDILEFCEHMGYVSPSDVAIEAQLLHTRICDWMPSQNTVMVAATAIAFRGQAYLFLGQSTHDKIAHALLWKDRFGADVRVINASMPLVRVSDDGEVRVYGSPWAGMMRWHSNMSAPLAGICFMEPGQDNSIRRLEPAKMLEGLLARTHLPRSGSELFHALGLLDSLLACAPLYELSCDVSENALRVSFEALTGLRFDDCAAR